MWDQQNSDKIDRVDSVGWALPSLRFMFVMLSRKSDTFKSLDLSAPSALEKCHVCPEEMHHSQKRVHHFQLIMTYEIYFCWCSFWVALICIINSVLIGSLSHVFRSGAADAEQNLKKAIALKDVHTLEVAPCRSRGWLNRYKAPKQTVQVMFFLFGNDTSTAMGWHSSLHHCS